MTSRKLMVVLVFLLFSTGVQADRDIIVFVDSGDTEGLIEAINTGNASTPPAGRSFRILIRPPETGMPEFEFDGPVEGTDAALPNITGTVAIEPLDPSRGPITFRPEPGSLGEFRLATVDGLLNIYNSNIENFGIGSGNGGAILANDGSLVQTFHCRFQGNFAGGNGGALGTSGRAVLGTYNTEFRENRCSGVGGAISIEETSHMRMDRCLFDDNNAGVFGCDVNVSSNGTDALGYALFMSNNVFQSNCPNVLMENPFGRVFSSSDTFSHPENGIDSTAYLKLFGGLFNIAGVEDRLQAAGQPPPKTQAMCNDFGTGAFASAGYNISADASCGLDQSTDLSGTDPMVDADANGYPMPQPGSPAIDSGATDVMVFEGHSLAMLPCGYRDVAGTARPQDANGDGVFECDRGAMEVPGAGAIVPGHSAVFFNPARNGEGNYVEILDDGRAVVYTFTYNPEGNGPAWFIGVGEHAGNSIVMDELFRPAGTAFGEAFDADEIVFTPAGSMSMVFPDCTADAPGGNIAYTGNEELGYEGLITRATRLAHITGCGGETPSPNAGLSGSFFDPARNGEGVIVEWLTNGDVLVVFFTYDPDGRQFWLFGQAAANGKTVTMDAVYPTGFTPWGSNFNPDDVMLSTWGSFTLTWTDCNTLVFEYNSTLPGFGAATRNYTRLSTLAGTACPMFP